MTTSLPPTLSAGEFLEEYIESLENLPSEVQQSLQELGKADAAYFELRESYRQHWKKYLKTTKRLGTPASEDAQMVAARLNIEKEYCTTMRKVDQKIDNSIKLYDLINRQIVRLDDEMLRLGIDIQDPVDIKKSIPFETFVNPDLSATSRGTKHSLPFVDRKNPKGPFSLPRSSPSGRKRASAMASMEIDPNEPLYCFCQQVSFGDMVGCDNDSCDKEWFHYGCVGLTEPPIGKWYCETCLNNTKNRK